MTDPQIPADQIPDDGTDEAPAATAGEQDHSDPWEYAGEDASPPTDDPED